MNTEDYADYTAPTTPPEQPERDRDQAPVPHARLGTHALLWVTLAICVALLVATASETWTRSSIERQAAQTRAQNIAIQQDTHQTQQEIAVAKSPATIEREARAWGYIRHGDTPVLIVPSPR
ncbi:MAG: septum formation initiator family protein [Ktedonobacterales bacterium]